MWTIPLMLLSAPASSAVADRLCGSDHTSDPELARRLAAEQVVEARIVFVSFPNEFQQIPVWSEALRAELTDYIAAMSRGQHQFNLSVLARPDAPGTAWLTTHPPSYYQPPDLGYAAVNVEVMTRIDSLLPNVWNGVEQVFMIHYRCAWTVDECSAVAWSGLGFVGAGSVPGFSGSGTTQRIVGSDVNAGLEASTAVHLAAHEYGHVLGFPHSPGTTPQITPPSELVNMGHYDAMTATASYIRHEGLFPYHPMWISDPDNVNWIPRVTLTSDTVGLRIPDVRGPNAVVYRVPTEDPTQSFLLVNHQGTTPWDVKYGNRGLLIWHLLGSPNARAWDLESADGKYAVVNGQLVRTQPDPVAGKDALEVSGSYLGGGADFFDGTDAADGHDDDRFTPNTNPNTGLYSSVPPLYSSAQSRPTALAFENMRRDPSTGDMLVDIRGIPPPIPPTQPAVAQNVPNPFGRITSIRFELFESSPVTVEVFDLQGRRLRRMDEGVLPAGEHVVAWDGEDASGVPVPASVYLYRVSAGAFQVQRKMVLLATGSPTFKPHARPTPPAKP